MAGFLINKCWSLDVACARLLQANSQVAFGLFETKSFMPNRKWWKFSMAARDWSSVATYAFWCGLWLLLAKQIGWPFWRGTAPRPPSLHLFSKLSPGFANLGEYSFKYFTMPKSLEVSHIGGLWQCVNSLHLFITWLVTIRCKDGPKETCLFDLDWWLSKFSLRVCCPVTCKNSVRCLSCSLFSASLPQMIILPAMHVQMSTLLILSSL